MQTTPCPGCGTPSRVREYFRQATRQDNGPVSLGFHGYCAVCDCSFPLRVELMQFVMAVAP